MPKVRPQTSVHSVYNDVKTEKRTFSSHWEPNILVSDKLKCLTSRWSKMKSHRIIKLMTVHPERLYKTSFQSIQKIIKLHLLLFFLKNIYVISKLWQTNMCKNESIIRHIVQLFVLWLQESPDPLCGNLVFLWTISLCSFRNWPDIKWINSFSSRCSRTPALHNQEPFNCSFIFGIMIFSHLCFTEELLSN